MRYSIKLSYAGSGFRGWQRQPSDPSVQQCLEEALGRLLGTETPVIGAGRTDTGVNAIGYVACFDGPAGLAAEDFRYKLNAILPRTVVVNSISEAAPDFHARFDAVRREYTYFLHRSKDPFVEAFSWQCGYPGLDFDAMNRAAAALVGTHDFSCFEKVGADNKTSVCTVFEAFWRPYIPSLTAICGGAAPKSPAAPGLPTSPLCGSVPSSAVHAEACSEMPGQPSARTVSEGVEDGTFPARASYGRAMPGPGAPCGTRPGPLPAAEGGKVPSAAMPDQAAGAVSEPQYWYFRISADRFLRNMVRAIVGTLIEVGRGKRSIADFAELVLPAQGSGIPSPDTPASADIPSADSGEAIPPLRAKDPSATHEGPAVRALPVRKPPLRSLAGESVPGHALFLSKIEY